MTYNIDVVERSFKSVDKAVMIGNSTSTLTVNSSSTITDFGFDEGQRAISFVASEPSPQGLVEINVKSALNGPYTVMVGEDPVEYRELPFDQAAGSETVKFAYPTGTHQITIIGTSVVPEFGPISLIILATLVSAIILLPRFASHWTNWNREA